MRCRGEVIPFTLKKKYFFFRLLEENWNYVAITDVFFRLLFLWAPDRCIVSTKPLWAPVSSTTKYAVRMLKPEEWHPVVVRSEVQHGCRSAAGSSPCALHPWAPLSLRMLTWCLAYWRPKMQVSHLEVTVWLFSVCGWKDSCEALGTCIIWAPARPVKFRSRFLVQPHSLI